jgi:hypothetical protein
LPFGGTRGDWGALEARGTLRAGVDFARDLQASAPRVVSDAFLALTVLETVEAERLETFAVEPGASFDDDAVAGRPGWDLDPTDLATIHKQQPMELHPRGLMSRKGEEKHWRGEEKP